jgi:hypothetical protein
MQPNVDQLTCLLEAVCLAQSMVIWEDTVHRCEYFTLKHLATLISCQNRHFGLLALTFNAISAYFFSSWNAMNE